MTRLVPFLLLAACGPKAAPATLDVGNDRVVEAHERTPCPDAGRVAEIARAVIGGGKLEASCVALWAGEPLWLIDGFAEVDTDEWYGVSEGTLLATTSGEVTWSEVNDEIPWGTFEAHAGDGYQVVDLDGDGDDELLYFGGYSKGGYSDTWVAAFDVRDGKLVVSEESVKLGSDNTAAVETEAEYEGCTEEHAVIPGPNGGQVLEVTRTPLANAPCDNLGHHVYAWDGHELKEIE